VFDQGPLWFALLIGLARVVQAFALHEVWGAEATLSGVVAGFCAGELVRCWRARTHWQP
jgi:hypothetical protein